MRRLLLIISICLMWPGTARADVIGQFIAASAGMAVPTPDQVVINEILANPTGTDTGNEWVELANVSQVGFDLGGTKLIRANGQVLAVLPAGTELPVGGYVVVRALNASLINTGDTLRLLAGDTELDHATYDGTGSEGQSWGRFGQTSAWTFQLTPGAANVLVPASPLPTPTVSPFSTAVPTITPTISANPTPGALPAPAPTPTATVSMPAATPSVASPAPSPISSPTPSSVPTGGSGPMTTQPVWLNEIMPNPVGSDSGQEWLELYNPSPADQDIGGWKVTRDNGTVLVTIPSGTVLSAGTYLWLNSLSNAVVNGGDTLRLTIPDGGVIDTVSYDDTGSEGQSWSRRDEGSGEWTDQPTPGAVNQFNQAEPPTTTSQPSGGSAATAPATAKAATAKTAAKATTKPKAAVAKSASTTKSGKLPQGGPGMIWYLVPLMAAAVYCYRRWMRQ